MSGATAVEHARLAGLIALGIVGGAVSLGLALEGFGRGANHELVGPIDAPPAPECLAVLEVIPRQL